MSDSEDQKIKQTRLLYFAQAQGAIKRQEQLVANDDEVLNFIRGQRRQKATPPVAVRAFWLLATAALIFAVVSISNRFYYFVQPDASFLSLNKPLQVQRSGLFWGKYSLTTQRYLMAYDEVTASSHGSIDLPFATHLAFSSHSRFRIELKENQNIIYTNSGQFIFKFYKDQETLLKRLIYLSSGHKLNITGTTVMLETFGKESLIYIPEGSADIIDKKGQVQGLQTGVAYKIKNESSFEKVPIASALPTIHAIATTLGAHLSNAPKKIERKKQITLQQLQKKYGRLTKLTLKDGRVLVGLYRDAGEFTYVTTVQGKEKIRTEKIADVEPYKLP